MSDVYRSTISSASEIYLRIKSKAVSIARIGARITLSQSVTSKLIGGLSSRPASGMIFASLQQYLSSFARLMSTLQTHRSLAAFLFARKSSSNTATSRIFDTLNASVSLRARIKATILEYCTANARVFVERLSLISNSARVIDRRSSRITATARLWGYRPRVRVDVLE